MCYRSLQAQICNCTLPALKFDSLYKLGQYEAYLSSVNHGGSPDKIEWIDSFANNVT